MRYYIIDSSAYIFALEKGIENISINFMEEKDNNKAFLYMPQMCVTEVLNTISKFRYSEESKKEGRQISDEIFKELYDKFIDQIHNRKQIYVYDLHRYHNINAGLEKYDGYDLYQANWKNWNEYPDGWVAKKNGKKIYKPPLSTIDILLIAMAIELKKIHCNDDVVILTNDKLIARVASYLSKKCGIRAVRIVEKSK